MSESITDASVQLKLEKGEALSPQEQEYVKGNPNGEAAPSPAPSADDDPEAIVIKKEKEEGAAAATEPAKKPVEEKPIPDTSAGGEKKETPEERRQLIESEISKPDGQQDLTKFTDNEIGLYWEQKKLRRRNQKLEEDNEILRVERIARKLKDEQAPPKKEPDGLEFLEGKDDEDMLTVAEARKLHAALKAQPAEKAKEDPKPDAKPVRTALEIKVERIEAIEKLKTKGIEDFDDVTQFAADALGQDEDARDILRETAKAGGNVAEKTYWLIKGSKAWPQIKKAIEDEKAKVAKPAETKKAPPAENLDRAKRLAENDGKIKTTGAGSGAGEVGEYTVEEIAAMSIDDIKSLPKETRKLILKKFGSSPNLHG